MNQLLLALIVIFSMTIQAMGVSAYAGDRDRDSDDSDMDGIMGGRTKALAATPSQDLPPIPEIETKVVGAPSTFPVLPPSKPCQPKDIVGLFKLSAVYEEPQGVETVGFQTNPNQYILFHRNTLFMRINVGDEVIAPKAVFEKMVEHTEDNMQYVVQENGFIYFYLDSVAVDVKVCFVVLKEKLPFKAGQILLMPPKGQITGRLVHSYDSLSPKKGEQTKRSAADDPNSNVVPEGKNSAAKKAYRARVMEIKKSKKQKPKKKKKKR